MANVDRDTSALEDDPLWYKDAIIYELHVRTFADKNDDGMGDFPGLTEKLDYLQDLGVTALWLLPFYPSPWKDDGYDIADYTDVHPAYGTLRDFRTFLREARRRGLRVITELVINHTSDQHPWFQRSRRAKPGSIWRDYYVWSDTPEKYQEARIIFKDFEPSNWSWDPVAHAYFWHRFYSQQPDLNYDNLRVHDAVFNAMSFWFRMGVDGMRLDAVPYLYEREGTNCENLPETHAFLKKLRRQLDESFRHRMLLAEANQWPEDAAAYFGNGDECHMAFHFPVMPRLFMAIRMEDRFPIVDILEQTPPIPETCQWAIFLRNHDELTLEMVTDEERDYMYRVYAHDPQMRINVGIRRRLAPLMGNDRRKIELMDGLLFSLPGTPVVYYGDEIGMGDNIYLGDRNGVRTPMQWSGDRNAGFSRANPQKLFLPVIIDPEYHYEAVNVESQQNNPTSMLWWTKRLIGLRKRYRAFGRGTLELLHPDNRKVLAFIRGYENERILAVFNLSRLIQCVSLELTEFQGMVPVELLGQTELPRIGEHPYFLTLGPYAFYWFALEPQPVGIEPVVTAARAERPALTVARSWENVFEGTARSELGGALATYLAARRWFAGKARRLRSAEVREAIPVRYDRATAYITLVQAEYTEGEPETYLLPLAYAEGETAGILLHDEPAAAVARLRVTGKGEGILFDALVERGFAATLLGLVRGRRRIRGAEGELVGWTTREFRRLLGEERAGLEPEVLNVEQSNTAIVYGERFFLKLFRRVEEGINPDLEIGKLLTDYGFPNTAPVAGAIEYRRGRAEPVTIAVLKGYVPNEGDAWTFTLDALGRYYEEVAASPAEVREPPLPTAGLLDLAEQEWPELVLETIGTYVDSAETLGRRTAELHIALATASEAPAFRPEPFGTLYQRSLYQSMRNLTGRVFHLLERQIPKLPPAIQEEARQILARRDEILKRFRAIVGRKIDALRTRTHGDYHLGQVLYTGKDFVIIDFEGEPARPLGERRLKRSPLSDVAGMVRSFHYAALAPLYEREPGGPVRTVDVASLEPWAHFWHHWVSAIFLRAYLEAAAPAGFLPGRREDLQVLLDVYLLEKAIYELGYELNNRPDWVAIPVRGLLELIRS